MRDPRARGTLEMVTGAMMISFSPVWVRIADVGPTVAAFYRVSLGSAALVVITLVAHRSIRPTRRQLGVLVLAGVLFAVDLDLWHRSIHYIGPGLATILASLQVFVLAAWGVGVLGERGDRLTMAVVLAMVGLFLVFGREWGGLSTDYHTGVFLGVASGVLYGAFLLVLRSVRVGPGAVPGAPAMAVVSLVSIGILAQTARWAGQGFAVPDATSWAALSMLGFVGHVLAWGLIARSIGKVDVSRAGLILLLQPALAFLWDVLFFDRATSTVEWAGVSLVLVAIYVGGMPGRRRVAAGNPTTDDVV